MDKKHLVTICLSKKNIDALDSERNKSGLIDGLLDKHFSAKSVAERRIFELEAELISWRNKLAALAEAEQMKELESARKDEEDRRARDRAERDKQLIAEKNKLWESLPAWDYRNAKNDLSTECARLVNLYEVALNDQKYALIRKELKQKIEYYQNKIAKR